MKIFSDVSARPLMKSLIDDEGGLYTQPKTNDTVLLCTPRNSASIPRKSPEIGCILKLVRTLFAKYIPTNTTTPPAEPIPPE
ncbi:hypothetical protein MTP99_013742 [Tenebrio molitor]|nr:hypothetical protein MTP99_013742 [Tenebrio molitor]